MKHWCLFICFLLFCCDSARAKLADEASQQLAEIDSIKVSNYAEFAAKIKSLSERQSELTQNQRDYLHYLIGWQTAYLGEYQQSLVALRELSTQSQDATIRFRSIATVVNVTILSKQYEEAFAQLRRLLEMLPSITDKSAREQGLSVAAYLYNNVGEYELALANAKTLREDNWRGKGVCAGGQLELQALQKIGQGQLNTTSFDTVINACEELNEQFRAGVVAVYAARWHMDNGRVDQAIDLLKAHYDGVLRSHSPGIASQYEALFAQGYRLTGNTALAKQFALRAEDSSVKNVYAEPLVNALQLLYLIAKEQNDVKAALHYHEKYMTADKGYLDDLSARQLAYQRVNQEVIGNRLQIEALNKQNQVLQLQRQLSDKAVENVRLYIGLLIMVVIFIGFWAYKTKRLQLHFMKLSRRDGLTGIFNRPYFIDQAELALLAAQKSHEEICVVVCDLDHFKSVNDGFGHAAGDIVLRQTAASLQAQLRRNDIVGRLGGEEFGIVLVGCDISAGRQRCEQMRSALLDLNIPEAGADFKLSASFGVAATVLSGHDFRQLLADADTALYRAKRSGRNCVVLHDIKASDTHSVEPIADRLRA